MKDPLGDIIKQYERESETRPTGDLPIIVRLDGKKFSSWTKGLRKPYDVRLSEIMKQVTIKLVEFSCAKIGYTQSDEITLVLLKPSERGQVLHGGRYQKLASTLASYASNIFNALVRNYFGGIPEKYDEQDPLKYLAVFDARVFEVPDLETAAVALEWRAEDCRRNSVSCAAQAQFSHSQLQKKSTCEMKDMLRKIDQPWEDLPEFYRNGFTVKKVTVTGKFTTEEIESLPEKHAARTNPDLEVTRSRLTTITSSILDTEDKVGFITC